MKRYFIAKVEIRDGEFEYYDNFLFSRDITIGEDVIGKAGKIANKYIDSGWAVNPDDYRIYTLSDITEVSHGEYDTLSKFMYRFNK